MAEVFGVDRAAAEYEAVESAGPPLVVDDQVDIDIHLVELLDGLVRFVRRFVFMTEAQAVAVALWVAHTWAFVAAETTPYLWVTSPEKRSGKTRLLEVLNLLVKDPWMTGRVTAAVLVRKVDAEVPALLLDESDAAFNGPQEYAEALRAILNTGYLRSGKASLCVGQGSQLSYRDFSTFSPKAIAGIGALPDTVADRSIPIRLRRRTKGEPVERFRRRSVEPEAERLRSQLEAWAAANVEVLRDADPPLPEELNDRAQDVAEPLLAIADLAGGEWPEKARRALVELCRGETTEDDSIPVRLLHDCRTAFDFAGTDRLSSADLCAALVGMAESPWAELQKGRPLTPNKLARLLRPFSVGSGTIRVDDGTAKGYYREAFEESWRRYSPAAEDPSETDPTPISGFQNVTTSQVNTGAGFLDFSNRHTENLVTDEKRDSGNAGLHCDGVTFENPDQGRGPTSEPVCQYHVGESSDPCDRCGRVYREHVT